MCRSTASQVRNVEMAAVPIADGCVFLWKTMYRRIQMAHLDYTPSLPVRAEGFTLHWRHESPGPRSASGDIRGPARRT